MARPRKNNAEYFSHDADMRNDIKIKALRRKFSHTGYAVWNYLLETLSDSDFFEIEWDEINIELLAADYDVSVEELNSIVEYSLKIGLLQMQGDKLYSETHKKRFSALLANRERKRVYGTKNSVETPENEVMACHNSAETNINDDYGNPKPHSKVKESKVKESKVEESKVEESKEKNYKKILLSEVKPSDFPNLKPDHIEIAKAFQNLFRNNLKEAGAATVKVDKAKGTWIDDIRLIFGDGYTNDDLRAVYGFLQSNSFWKKNILSTSKLREKFDKLKLEIKHGTGRRNDNKNAGRDLGELAEILHKHTTAFS